MSLSHAAWILDDIPHVGMISGIFAIRLPENSQKKNLRHENYMQRYKISTLMIIDKLII